MFSLFDLFGRSAAVKALDHALREAGVHQLLVPEAVKLTILKIERKDRGAEDASQEAAHADAARLLAYCMLRREQFIKSNDLVTVDRVEERSRLPSPRVTRAMPGSSCWSCMRG